ncbi:hypothetical protein DOTSEDRAFT_69248 [Dothistroma septosporum NZE10]|uniref:Uncharacterized protein n=1 Tax=Dothistroma septosporum (strain NZE10 / CBS 128990) TaxID=675120 RepID=N1PUS0_DOTSN|nr:hypothetical protein DOTSEDRAFT_69248 [Dothistroma septosporum NZE10]
MARTKELFHHINEHIYQGKPLLLQRTSFVAEGESVVCERPGCEEALAANVYYLCLGTDSCFCVRCFEMLWNGECTGGLPIEIGTPRKTPRRDSAVMVGIPQLDGTFDRLHIQQPVFMRAMHAQTHDTPAEPSAPLAQSGIMECMHASSDDDAELVRPVGPVCAPERRASFSEAHLEHDDPGTPDTLDSTDSNGEWRYPPTYFQKIHYGIEPGATLSEIDKAVLALWKHVSVEQWRWNGHLARTDARRAFHADETSEDESLRMEALTSYDADEEEVNGLMSLTGLRKKDCQGRDLSVVLKEAVEIQNQRQRE